jgi:hypothetical protein
MVKTFVFFIPLFRPLWSPLFDWFLAHFIVILVEIIGTFNLKGRVSRSYIKNYRWLERKKEEPCSIQMKPRRYRTILEVQAPSKLSLRLSLIVLDAIYTGIGAYGVYIYSSNRENILKDYSEFKLLTIILPFLSSLGCIMSLRLVASIFFFLIVPYYSVKI